MLRAASNGAADSSTAPEPFKNDSTFNKGSLCYSNGVPVATQPAVLTRTAVQPPPQQQQWQWPLDLSAWRRLALILAFTAIVTLLATAHMLSLGSSGSSSSSSSVSSLLWLQPGHVQQQIEEIYEGLTAAEVANLEDVMHALDPPPYRHPVAPYVPLADWQVQPPLRTEEPAGTAASGGYDSASASKLQTWGGHVALCLAVKDQTQDMPEWLEWHRRVGVEKFYVFDMGSKTPMNQTLKVYLDSGLVEYHYVVPNAFANAAVKPQLEVYDTCIHKFRHRHSWMGFLDADEFIILRDRSQNVSEFLKAYDAHGALGVFWVPFGSSGHETRPADGNLRSYWKCLGPKTIHARHVKSIVNLKYVARPYKDPHTFTFTDSKRTVNERFAYVDQPIHKYHTSEKIALHHYVLKSRQEYQEKMARGSAMRNKKSIHFFNSINAQSTEECRDGIAAAEELDFEVSPQGKAAAAAAAEIAAEEVAAAAKAAAEAQAELEAAATFAAATAPPSAAAAAAHGEGPAKVVPNARRQLLAALRDQRRPGVLQWQGAETWRGAAVRAASRKRGASKAAGAASRGVKSWTAVTQAVGPSEADQSLQRDIAAEAAEAGEAQEVEGGSEPVTGPGPSFRSADSTWGDSGDARGGDPTNMDWAADFEVRPAVRETHRGEVAASAAGSAVADGA